MVALFVELHDVRAGLSPRGSGCEMAEKERERTQSREERHNTFATKLLPAGGMGRISDGLCPNLITRQAGRPFFLAFLGFSDSGRDIGDWALPISPGVKYERRVQHCAKKFLLRLVRECLSGLMDSVLAALS